MRSFALTALLTLTMAATAAFAADTTTTTTTKTTATAKTQPGKQVKPAAMTATQRQDLEKRIDDLERKYEMQYHETDSPTGAQSAPAAEPATH